MKNYSHVFFDLDQTLWDFDRCSAETIHELFEKHNLSISISCGCEKLVDKFSDVNNLLWEEFSLGKITKEQLRYRRFRLVFEELGELEEDVINSITEDYLAICPKKGHLVPYAEEVLNYLFDRYNLHIITNGFEEVQQDKILNSGLGKYFKEIITSDTIGYKKPEKEIFSYALNKVNSRPSECIMIGDSLEADIVGASNSRIDHVFYNPRRLKYMMSVTHEIGCLRELKRIL